MNTKIKIHENHISEYFIAANKTSCTVINSLLYTCTLISSKDTINNDASIDLALLNKVQLNVFTKSTGIIVVDGLGIAKGFQYWTKRKITIIHIHVSK